MRAGTLSLSRMLSMVDKLQEYLIPEIELKNNRTNKIFKFKTFSKYLNSKFKNSNFCLKPFEFKNKDMKLLYCHRFLIRVKIFKLIRRLEVGEN